MERDKTRRNLLAFDLQESGIIKSFQYWVLSFKFYKWYRKEESNYKHYWQQCWSLLYGLFEPYHDPYCRCYVNNERDWKNQYIKDIWLFQGKIDLYSPVRMYRKSYCPTPGIGVGSGGVDKMWKSYFKVFLIWWARHCKGAILYADRSCYFT